MTDKLLIANWKSFKNTEQVDSWLIEYQKTISLVSLDGAHVTFAPPFPLLGTVQTALQKFPATLKGAHSLTVQDISPFPAGAYTGAVTAENLTGLGVKYALVGHSERRRYFHETHQEIANKVEQALAANITPIVCVDEEYIVAQAAAISPDLYSRCWVAYEPLAAIGSGSNMPATEVTPVIKKIRNAFGSVPVMYGGSVSGSTVAEYLSVSDGVLVGTASRKVSDFVAVVQASAS